MIVHRPSVRTTGKPIFYLALSSKFGSSGATWCCTSLHIISHPCCDQLTAVKTGYPLTSIISRIAGSGIDPSRSSIFLSYPLTVMKFICWNSYVVFEMSLWPRTIKILIANWPRTRKFSHFSSDLFLRWSRVGHVLRPIFMLWLLTIRQVSSWGNLCSILKLAYFDSWSWQSFMSTCDVFNFLFPLDVQNEIQLLSRVFCYSRLVCYWVFGCEMRRLTKSENPRGF